MNRDASPGSAGGADDHAHSKADRFNASNSLTIRLKLCDKPGTLGVVTTLIGHKGVDIGAIDIVGHEADGTVRDFTLNVVTPEAGLELVEALRGVPGVEVVNFSDQTFRAHLGGKIEIVGKTSIKDRDDLSRIYTPGVARVCKAIAADPNKVHSLTMKGNTIAIVSDGSRVLALGNIGPYGALPVMEGKALLFKRFGNVNAVPIVLGTQDPEQIIAAVKAIAPTFGGINLEDIASPGCWEIERRLKEELDIPIFHDDQHGTAVVVLAATINAAKVVKKQLRHLRIVVSGVGAAGMACCRLLMAAGVKNIVGFNINGPIYRGRTDLNSEEQWLAANSNPKNFKGSMRDALKGADMFLGLSAAGVIQGKDLTVMRRDPIVFALANPVPEVTPEAAAAHGARIIATGGSEYANQINNSLAFPGIFKGVLQCRARFITDEMKMEAARALAGVVPKTMLSDEYIIPGMFNEKAHEAVTQAVIRVAHATGQARRPLRTR